MNSTELRLVRACDEYGQKKSLSSYFAGISKEAMNDVVVSQITRDVSSQPQDLINRSSVYEPVAFSEPDFYGMKEVLAYELKDRKTSTFDHAPRKPVGHVSDQLRSLMAEDWAKPKAEVAPPKPSPSLMSSLPPASPPLVPLRTPDIKPASPPLKAKGLSPPMAALLEKPEEPPPMDLALNKGPEGPAFGRETVATDNKFGPQVNMYLRRIDLQDDSTKYDSEWQRRVAQAAGEENVRIAQSMEDDDVPPRLTAAKEKAWEDPPASGPARDDYLSAIDSRKDREVLPFTDAGSEMYKMDRACREARAALKNREVLFGNYTEPVDKGLNPVMVDGEWHFPDMEARLREMQDPEKRKQRIQKAMEAKLQSANLGTLQGDGAYYDTQGRPEGIGAVSFGKLKPSVDAAVSLDHFTGRRF